MTEDKGKRKEIQNDRNYETKRHSKKKNLYSLIQIKVIVPEAIVKLYILYLL